MTKKSRKVRHVSSEARKSEDDSQSDEDIFLAALTTEGSTSENNLPGPVLLRSDVSVCLKDVITDHIPVVRSEIGAETQPSKLGKMDRQGWGTCLYLFELYLQIRRPIYAFYDHKPRYTQDTFDMKFPKIIDYLARRIVAQYNGNEP